MRQNIDTKSIHGNNGNLETSMLRFSTPRILADKEPRRSHMTLPYLVNQSSLNVQNKRISWVKGVE